MENLNVDADMQWVVDNMKIRSLHCRMSVSTAAPAAVMRTMASLMARTAREAWRVVTRLL